VEILNKFVKAVRPETWDDVDDEWVAYWTPFRDKATAMCFFSTFVLSRVKFFESWHNFQCHKLQPVDYSEVIAQALANLEQSSGKKVELADRTGKVSKKRKREGTEQFVKRFTVEQGRDKKFRLAASGGSQELAPRKETKRGSYAYRPHGSNGMKLSILQEFFIYMMFLRRGIEKSQLAEKFFANRSKASAQRINSVLRTWASAIYEILQAEEWWLSPEDMDQVRSTAFSGEEGKLVLNVSDCTNVNCECSNTSELVGTQLYSVYTSTHVGNTWQEFPKLVVVQLCPRVKVAQQVTINACRLLVFLMRKSGQCQRVDRGHNVSMTQVCLPRPKPWLRMLSVI
jgi:hypothetical protein